MNQDLTKKLHRHSLGLVRLKTRGFRQFQKEVDIELGQINVFVGPNGSGKSTITKLIRLIHEIYQKKSQHQVPAELSWSVGLAMSPGDKFEFDLDFADNNYRLYRHSLSYEVDLSGDWKLLEFDLLLANKTGRFRSLISTERDSKNEIQINTNPSCLKQLAQGLKINIETSGLTAYANSGSALNPLTIHKGKRIKSLLDVMEDILKLSSSNQGIPGVFVNRRGRTGGELLQEILPHFSIESLGQEFRSITLIDLNMFNDFFLDWLDEEVDLKMWIRQYLSESDAWADAELYLLLQCRLLSNFETYTTTKSKYEGLVDFSKRRQAKKFFRDVTSIGNAIGTLISALFEPIVLQAESPSGTRNTNFSIYEVAKPYRLTSRAQSFAAIDPSISSLLNILESDREKKRIYHRKDKFSKNKDESKTIIRPSILGEEFLLEMNHDTRTITVKGLMSKNYLSDYSYGEQRAFFLDQFMRQAGIKFFEEPESGLHPKFQSFLGRAILSNLFETIFQIGFSSNAEPFEPLKIEVDEIDENSFVQYLVAGDTWSLRARIAFVETHSEYFIRAMQLKVAERFKKYPEKATEPIRGIKIYYIEKDKKGNATIKDMGLRFDGMLAKSFGPGFFDESTTLTMKLLDLYKMN